MEEIKISVFTPTYNREGTLGELYNSIKKQTFSGFEWIIVDDGSTDGTETLVNTFKEDSNFSIKYFKQENQGKHIAQNRAVDISRGELFLPLDSDDTVTPDALQTLWDAWQSIPLDKRQLFSGVACHCMDQYGDRIGSAWPQSPFISNDLEVYFKYKVRGEKWGAIRTDIMRECKNANVKGHFLDESTVWFRIARKYQKLYIDKCLRIYVIRQDSVQKRTRESELQNAESKLYANLIYINEFYDWYIKYNRSGIVRRSLKVVYYASLMKKHIFKCDGVLHQVKPFFCKLIVFLASPYALIERIR